MCPRSVAAPLALALSAFGCARSPTPEPVKAVVLLTCDTLRADRLGFLGCARATSPALDALAQEALVYESAWSTAPLTGPAVAALLTGRTPEEMGFEDNRFVLSSKATTLAERLTEAGIETAAVVSNWVLRRRSDAVGAGVPQGFAHFDDRMESPEPSRPTLKERLADDTTDAALAWLDARARSGAGARPFFLWVHYQDPHGPYTPPSACLDAPEPAAAGELELTVGPNERGEGALPLYQVVDDERRPAVYRARYEAEIRFFDRELGRLVAGLRARGILDEALLVFTADHGESLGEHGYFFSHGQNLHQELVRVPLLVRPPGGAVAPRRVRAPASHLDLFPTVMAAFGLEAGPTRGLDLLAGELPEERVLPQYLRGGWSATGVRHRLLVEHDVQQLFDLAADPREEHDLAAREPELVRSMTEGHRAFVGRIKLGPLKAARPALDEDGQKELDALGYGGEDGER